MILLKNMKCLIFFLPVIFSIDFVYSQEKNNNIRKEHSLKLLVDDNSVYETKVEATPIIIRDSVIQVYPGDKLFIEADVVNGYLKNFVVVNEIRNKNKTLIFEFKQIVKGKKHEQMSFCITNPFKKDLEYTCSIYLMKYKKWIKTTVSPVGASIKSYELWSDLITTMTISSLHLVK